MPLNGRGEADDDLTGLTAEVFGKGVGTVLGLEGVDGEMYVVPGMIVGEELTGTGEAFVPVATGEVADAVYGET